MGSGVIEKLYTLLKIDVEESRSNIALVYARIGKSGKYLINT